MMNLRLIGAALAVPLLIAATSATAEQDWKAPRTAWGDPDLTGHWPIDYLAQTPRQRAASFGTRDTLTDAEYQAALQNAQGQIDQYAAEGEAGKLGMGHWIERGKPLRQASLMTEPADGRLPPMTAEGARLAALQKSSWTESVFNWVDDFNPFDRCISRGMPSSMLPGNYNSGIDIYQGPGYVAIALEMIHETRLVRLDAAAPPPPGVINWLGYSRGHWDGDALVIETSNFVPGSPIGNVGASPRPVPNSAQMTIVEKLTPTGPDTIRYEMWVSDPAVLTAPFKFDFPWQRNTAYEQYEYACHEGNVQLRGYIEGTGTSPAVVARREATVKARDGGSQ